jgi:hypothetical protein
LIRAPEKCAEIEADFVKTWKSSELITEEWKERKARRAA